MKQIGHWISGRATAVGSERTHLFWEPARGDQQASVHIATEIDVDDAVQAALLRFRRGLLHAHEGGQLPLASAQQVAGQPRVA